MRPRSRDGLTMASRIDKMHLGPSASEELELPEVMEAAGLGGTKYSNGQRSSALAKQSLADQIDVALAEKRVHRQGDYATAKILCLWRLAAPSSSGEGRESRHRGIVEAALNSLGLQPLDRKHSGPRIWRNNSHEVVRTRAVSRRERDKPVRGLPKVPAIAIRQLSASQISRQEFPQLLTPNRSTKII